MSPRPVKPDLHKYFTNGVPRILPVGPRFIFYCGAEIAIVLMIDFAKAGQ